MARSLAGLDLQTTIAGHLKNNSFRVQEEEEWDHNNKIDFVITKFPRFPKLTSIGVQVTTRCKDSAKLSEFVAKNDPKSGNVTVADKTLYLEIEENVDINKGGADLVANVLYAFQFDEQFSDTKLWAATIQAKPDSISYRFFDPRKPASVEVSPKATLAAPETKIVDLKNSAERLAKALANGKVEMEGRLRSYFTERGYGFIEAQDGSTYYMHINDVKDNVLSADINALMKLPGTTPLNYHVLFEDGGKTRAETAYKTAKNIRLLLKD